MCARIFVHRPLENIDDITSIGKRSGGVVFVCVCKIIVVQRFGYLAQWYICSQYTQIGQAGEGAKLSRQSASQLIVAEFPAHNG